MTLPFTLGLDSMFPFGKCKGKRVGDVLRSDFPYIVWLVQEDVYDFTDEFYEAYEDISKAGIA